MSACYVPFIYSLSIYLCQSHSVLITVALRSCNISPPALLPFRIVLTILVFLPFHINFRVSLSVSTKSTHEVRRTDIFTITSLSQTWDICIYLVLWFISPKFYGFPYRYSTCLVTTILCFVVLM